MAKTVLITGSSTGIGLATAKHFIAAGWNVAATMRSPDKNNDLQLANNVIKPALDVTGPESIAAAIIETHNTFGQIDVIVNNAGYGLSGTFESMSLEEIKQQFETNVFGLMEVTRQILPLFRQRKAGTIINVASMGGRLTFPLYSVYHSTKWAVDGFSESLQFELKPLNIRVRIVEPGAIKTDFYDRSATFRHDESITEYNDYVHRAQKSMTAAGAKGAPPEKVAAAIYKAAISDGWKLRYPVGIDAKSMLMGRRFMTDGMYQAAIGKAIAG